MRAGPAELDRLAAREARRQRWFARITKAEGWLSVFGLGFVVPILKMIGLGSLAPNADPALDGKLNLTATAWFGILAGALTWIMPGVNALLVRRTRPDLVKDAPFARWLPILGLVWLAFALSLYWYAGVYPIVSTLAGGTQDALGYLNQSGVSFLLIILVVGIVWYLVRSAWNRRAGVETELMYQMLPPD